MVSKRIAPAKQCDLIMKGGLTSGIVYPSAIYEISKDHRLINIGGASAGAIAAVTAASAEFRRQEDSEKSDFSGFTQLAAVPDILGNNLIKLFQPNPEYRSLFEFALAWQAKSRLTTKLAFHNSQADDTQIIKETTKKLKIANQAVFKSLWRAIRAPILFISVPFIFVLVQLVLNQAWGWVAFFALAYDFIGAAVSLKKFLSYRPQNLERHNFGLCTGLTQSDDYEHPALTEWLGDQIDGIAWGCLLYTSPSPRD